MKTVHKNVVVLMDLLAQIDLYWIHMRGTSLSIHASRSMEIIRISKTLDGHVDQCRNMMLAIENCSAVADTASNVTPLSLIRQQRDPYEVRRTRTHGFLNQ